MKLCFSNLFCMDKSGAELYELCAAHKIDAVELRTDADGHFQYDDRLTVADIAAGVCLKGYEAEKICEAKKILDSIKNTDIKAVRVFLGNFAQRYDDKKEKIEYGGIVKALRELCAYSQKEIWVETHNEFATGKVLKKLAEDVCCDNLKFIWDIVHPIEDGEDYAATYGSIGDKTAHIHIKDAKPNDDKIWHDYRYTRLGEGALPIKEIVLLLNENGYNGYFSLEWESLWRTELASLDMSPDEILSEFTAFMSGICREEK